MIRIACSMCLALVFCAWVGCGGGGVQKGLDGGAGMAANGGVSGGGAGTGAGGASPGGSGGVGGAGKKDAGPGGAEKRGAGGGPFDAALDGAGADSGSGDGSGGADASGAADSAARGTGPGDWGPGDFPSDINAQTYLEISGVTGQKNYTRQYKVHVPPQYDSNTPTPLVFCIHGLMQNAVMFCVTGAAMNVKSDKEGFILVMPNGYQNSWNAGTCCGGASAEQLNDVALFRAILEEVGKHLNVDLNRVYATGLSNGGFMSYRLACEASDIFAAVAPGAGSIGTNDMAYGTNLSSDFTVCDPSRKIPVLDIHGTSDALVPYSLQKPSLEHMATKDGCSLNTSPSSDPKSGGDTNCVTYDGCPSGIEVIGCSIQGGGHCWFGSPDCGTGGGAIGLAVVGANSDTMVNNDAAWNFFKRHSR